MRVLVKNVTGSQKEEAELFEASGVLLFDSGDISHVAHEKHMNKQIEILREIKKEEPKQEAPSPEQSKERPGKKSKAK